MNSAFLATVALFCYVLAAVGYSAPLFLHNPASASAPPVLPASGLSVLPSPSQFGWLKRPFLLLGIVLQFVAIGAWCLTTHRSPFASEYGTLSVFAWAVALSFCALAWRARMAVVGAVALPVACVALVMGLTQAGGPIAQTPLLRSQIVSIHVLSILASFGLFALAFGCALLYLLQNRLLKQRSHEAVLKKMPPLQTLDSVGFHAVAYGLPLLTIGLALGIAYVYRTGVAQTPVAWLTDPRNLVSFGIWLLYVAYLVARLLLGWRGIRLQYILLVGLIAALALYVLPSTTHHFGTLPA